MRLLLDKIRWCMRGWRGPVVHGRAEEEGAASERSIGRCKQTHTSTPRCSTRDQLDLASPDLCTRPVVMSSSLAGALASPDTAYEKTNFKQDVDMHPSSFDDASPDAVTEHHHLKQEEEMGDLFGEDSNVDFVHHGR
jgi:hypothetical protein